MLYYKYCIYNKHWDGVGWGCGMGMQTVAAGDGVWMGTVMMGTGGDGEKVCEWGGDYHVIL